MYSGDLTLKIYDIQFFPSKFPQTGCRALSIGVNNDLRTIEISFYEDTYFFYDSLDHRSQLLLIFVAFC